MRTPEAICLAPPTECRQTFPDVEGWTGKLVQQLLHDLADAAADQGVYLEVGCYQGKTLLAAAQSRARCWGIEDYSQRLLGTQLPVDVLRDKLRGNIQLFGGPRVTLVEQSYQRAFASGVLPKIAVYFYDGVHDFDNQRRALLDVLPCLIDGAIVVVDDACTAAARQATEHVLSDGHGYTLLNHITEPLGIDGYWNGLYLLRWNGA